MFLKLSWFVSKILIKTYIYTISYIKFFDKWKKLINNNRKRQGPESSEDEVNLPIQM